MRSQHDCLARKVAMEEVHHVRCRLLVTGHQFNAVACGEDHALAHARRAHQGLRRLAQRLWSNRQSLPYLNWGRAMVYSQQANGHGAGNLCTELN